MNLFSISSIILALSGIIFSLIIYRTDRENKVNKAWFFSCISLGLWALGLSGVTLSDSAHMAFGWQCLLDVSAIFLPFLSLLFFFELFNIKAIAVRWTGLIVATVFSIFSFSPLFKVGMTLHYGLQWVDPGPLYIVFPVYFILYGIISLSLLITYYVRTDKKSILRYQIRNILFGSTIAYVAGATNFFPQFFSAYPFGNYFVIFYIVFMVYGVIRYKALSAKVISAQIFSMALSIVSLFNLLKSNGLTDWLLNMLILALVGVFSIFLVNSVNREVKAREKIEKLAQDLETANIRLTELDRQKSEFVSFATHQLRAPLTAMKGYASMILEGDMGALSDEAKKGVSRIYDSAQTLTNIVDDYLNITRIELGTMKYAFETIDWRTLIDDILGELKPNIERSKLAFSFTVADENMDYRITADRDKFKQVIANLIDNSMKYTPKGSVALSLSFDRARRKFVFMIKDTGIGIAPEVLPHLFAKWSRAGNANKTNIKGTGLGLFVAKEIITAHHGEVRAESPGEGKGSTFIVEMEPFGKM